jgi:glucose/arabinose dehydrogenase
MRNQMMKRTLSCALVALATISAGVFLMRTETARGEKMRSERQSEVGQGSGSQTCPDDDSGLKLPPGFCATVFAENIGHARHMVVAPNGVLYVNTWSGRYYGNDTPHAGGFLVALQDKNGSGKADVVERFGETIQTGGHGGTGIGIYKESIYAESNDQIVRYSLSAASIVPSSSAQTIVSGLPLSGDHPMHPFIISTQGKMYVDVATPTNSCQVKNRQLESPGENPCTELETRGGVWLYDANKTNQTFSPAERYATGIRNAEGFAIDSSGRIFVTQHGRDQLHANWPNIYRPEQEATLPSEELLLLKAKGDYGWPECYDDPFVKQLVLAPEYGGDGKTIGVCARRQNHRRMCEQNWCDCRVSRPLGAECHGALRHGTISSTLSRRRFHRFPRLVGQGAISSRRLQRGFSGARWGPRIRSMRNICRWLRGSGRVAS